MSDISGSYDLSAQTPLGSQSMTLVVQVDGDTFTGRSQGTLGTSEVAGSVTGNTIAWRQAITVPVPLTLDCTLTIDGDMASGAADSGAFGSFPLAGRRAN